ncbi:MAG: GNAT family N-acetyltransferase [Holosporales bacterium]|jgi:RimJ/RimL family protein N-acetyltransferase|nr:GNAT family N-acetyltransferase [Holosporales bacterium]
MLAEKFIASAKNHFLQPIQFDDWSAMFEIYSDPNSMRFIQSCDGSTYNAQSVQNLVESLAAKNSEAPLEEFTLTILKDDKAIGFVSISKLNEAIPEISCCIIPSMQRKGVASSLISALQLLVDCGIETLGALVHPQNIGSKRVLEKIGFSYVDPDCLKKYNIPMERYILRNINEVVSIPQIYGTSHLPDPSKLQGAAKSGEES